MTETSHEPHQLQDLFNTNRQIARSDHRFKTMQRRSLLRSLRVISMVIVPSVKAFSSVATPSLSKLLKDPSLLDWPASNLSSNTDAFDVIDPANPHNVIAQVPSVDAKKAIEASNLALADWKDGTTAAARGALLTAWSAKVQANAEDLATIMTMESGKPLQESRGEVQYAASFLDYYAAEAIRPTGSGGGFLTPSPFSHPDSGGPRGRVMAVHQAVGVCAMITPWNFPLAMITRKVGPALAAGCTAVVKPSELTPLCAIAMSNLGVQAGIPSNVFQVVTASATETPSVGKEFCSNPLVRKISFTGSTRVGKYLMEQSSSTVKRLSLELGGNAPFVVFEDADLDQAVSAAMASKFRNAGQTCVCADRFLIHDSLHGAFVQKLASRAQEVKVGPGMEEGVGMGPLITESAAQEVHRKVLHATKAGATCDLGGLPLKEVGPHFYPLTILTDVTSDMEIWQSETFGPVAAIQRFLSEDEALAMANDSNVGLAAYFCTQDLSRVFRFSEKLETGIVGVNDGIISTAAAPFGGVKESGLGREGSAMGLDEYLETKYIFLNA